MTLGRTSPKPVAHHSKHLCESAPMWTEPPIYLCPPPISKRAAAGGRLPECPQKYVDSKPQKLQLYPHTYVHAFTHTFMYACMHAYIHTYQTAYITTRIDTCLDAYIHTHIHTNVKTYSQVWIWMQTYILIYVYL